MIALLQSPGTKPTESIYLYNEVNGCAMQYFNFLNNSGGREAFRARRKVRLILQIAAIAQYSMNTTDCNVVPVTTLLQTGICPLSATPTEAYYLFEKLR